MALEGMCYCLIDQHVPTHMDIPYLSTQQASRVPWMTFCAQASQMHCCRPTEDFLADGSVVPMWPAPAELEKVAEDDTVLLTAATCGYGDLLTNWIKHVWDLQIRCFYVAAADNATAEFLGSWLPGHAAQVPQRFDPKVSRQPALKFERSRCFQQLHAMACWQISVLILLCLVREGLFPNRSVFIIKCLHLVSQQGLCQESLIGEEVVAPPGRQARLWNGARKRCREFDRASAAVCRRQNSCSGTAQTSRGSRP